MSISTSSVTRPSIGIRSCKDGRHKHRKVFTTGQVAMICGVAARTATTWFDAGRFPGGYRIPGSRDRRIPRKGLLHFLRQTGTPKEWLYNAVQRVLLIGLEKGVADIICAELPLDDYQSDLVTDLFQAGVKAVEYEPNILVIDTAIGRKSAADLCREFRQRLDIDMAIVVTYEDDQDEEPYREAGYTHVCRRPFNPSRIANTIRRISEETLPL